MPDINTNTNKQDSQAEPSTVRQLLWFIALYACGLLLTGAIVYGLKALLTID